MAKEMLSRARGSQGIIALATLKIHTGNWRGFERALGEHWGLKAESNRSSIGSRSAYEIGTIYGASSVHHYSRSWKNYHASSLLSLIQPQRDNRQLWEYIGRLLFIFVRIYLQCWTTVPLWIKFRSLLGLPLQSTKHMPSFPCLLLRDNCR